MSDIEEQPTEIATTLEPQYTSLPFPPVTSTHILNCSFHSWYPRLRAKTPKARLIELSPPFLDYLRADGILLPPEPAHDGDSGYSDDEDDPSQEWSEVHQKIYDTIEELGGKVVPKLNWSAPKGTSIHLNMVMLSSNLRLQVLTEDRDTDATFMSTTNDMECRTPNDIYLLLKSSDFITHDLEHPFDDCTIDHHSDQQQPSSQSETLQSIPIIPYRLILRKSFQLNPSLEFRCFVRNKTVIAISQREMNHFPFLFDLRNQFKSLITKNIPDFPDPNFVFDVYIPPPHEKVWIIDINPWAPRTDPLLFSWLELLTLPVPEIIDGEREEEDGTIFEPEFRLVERDDPEAYQFTSTKYSAHKLPKDVVDASMTPSAMKDMMEEWRRVQLGEVGDDSDDEEQGAGGS